MSPNFHPFCSRISRFQDISHFRNFRLTLMLKFESATLVLILAGHQNIHNFISLMTALIFSVTFSSDRIKAVGVVF